MGNLASIGCAFAVGALVLILIHFFGVRIRKTIDFSQIQFLSNVLTQSKAVQKFKNFLLFSIRFFVILFLFGASFIFLKESNLSEMNDNRELVLIDDSWSMQSNYLSNNKSKLQTLVEDLDNIKQQIGNSTVNTTSGKSVQFDSLQHLDSYFQNQLPEKGNLSSFKLNNRLIFGSDFQKSNSPKLFFEGLSANSKLTLVNFGNPDQENIYVDSVWLESPVVRLGDKVTLNIRVHKSELNSSSGIKVRLLHGETQIGSSEISMGSSASSVVQFGLNTKSTNAASLKVVVDDQVNPFDNVYYCVLPKFEESPIKLLPILKPSHPIIKALNQEPNFTIDNTPGKNQSVWIFQPSSAFNREAENLIRTWLGEGKNIIMVPTPDNASKLLSLLQSVGLKDISLRPTSNDIMQLAPLDFSDPFFQNVFERNDRRISMPGSIPVFMWESSYHSILSFTDKSPFLSSFKVGNGFVYLFAAPLEESEFANHSLFVPVLYQLLIKSYNSQPLAYSASSKSINLPSLASSNRESYIELRKGEDVFVPEFKVNSEMVELILPEHLKDPGFYDVYSNGVRQHTLAINIPSSESNLKSYSNKELENLFLGSPYQVDIIQADEIGSFTRLLKKETLTSQLAKYCLILCLILLIVEVLILRQKRSGAPN